MWSRLYVPMGVMNGRVLWGVCCCDGRDLNYGRSSSLTGIRQIAAREDHRIDMRRGVKIPERSRRGGGKIEIRKS
jgi:hypothetical protein